MPDAHTEGPPQEQERACLCGWRGNSSECEPHYNAFRCPKCGGDAKRALVALPQEQASPTCRCGAQGEWSSQYQVFLCPDPECPRRTVDREPAFKDHDPGPAVCPVCKRALSAEGFCYRYDCTLSESQLPADGHRAKSLTPAELTRLQDAPRPFALDLIAERDALRAALTDAFEHMRVSGDPTIVAAATRARKALHG